MFHLLVCLGLKESGTVDPTVCVRPYAHHGVTRNSSRFGHVNFATLKKMAKAELVRGLPALEHVEQICEACLAGKHRRAPFPQQASRCA
jgi:hypothetical protein